MSEPIFIAWDSKNKRWIKDFCVKPDGSLFRVIFSDLTGNVLTVDIKDAVLCRSTGLRDSKRTKEFPEGEMIFEFDIIKSDCGDVYLIEFDDGSFVVKMNNENKARQSIFKNWMSRMEIIGNIFENPELLEQKQ